jgi:chloride channel protein, CIC family
MRDLERRFIAAIVRAPLTGIVLILEMTGNYEQMLPLLTSCFCAYAVAEYLRDVPIYEAFLERDLMRGGITATHQQPFVVNFDVEEGAPFCGRQVRELGRPAGCILVRYEIAGREYVPAAETRLLPHSRITAVITPEAKNARSCCDASARPVFERIMQRLGSIESLRSGKLPQKNKATKLSSFKLSN